MSEQPKSNSPKRYAVSRTLFNGDGTISERLWYNPSRNALVKDPFLIDNRNRALSALYLCRADDRCSPRVHKLHSFRKVSAGEVRERAIRATVKALHDFVDTLRHHTSVDAVIAEIREELDKMWRLEL